MPERKVECQLDFEYDPKDSWTPIEDVLENLDNLVKLGKVEIWFINPRFWGIKVFKGIRRKNFQNDVSSKLL